MHFHPHRGLRSHSPSPLCQESWPSFLSWVPPLNSRLKTWPGRYPTSPSNVERSFLSRDPGILASCPSSWESWFLSCTPLRNPPFSPQTPSVPTSCCPLALAFPGAPLLSCPEREEEGGLCLRCPPSPLWGWGEALVNSCPSSCCRKLPAPHCTHTSQCLPIPTPEGHSRTLRKGRLLGAAGHWTPSRSLAGVLIADS